jgi:hypothetical protein
VERTRALLATMPSIVLGSSPPQRASPAGESEAAAAAAAGK